MKQSSSSANPWDAILAGEPSGKRDERAATANPWDAILAESGAKREDGYSWLEEEGSPEWETGEPLPSKLQTGRTPPQDSKRTEELLAGLVGGAGGYGAQPGLRARPREPLQGEFASPQPLVAAMEQINLPAEAVWKGAETGTERLAETEMGRKHPEAIAATLGAAALALENAYYIAMGPAQAARLGSIARGDVRKAAIRAAVKADRAAVAAKEARGVAETYKPSSGAREVRAKMDAIEGMRPEINVGGEGSRAVELALSAEDRELLTLINEGGMRERPLAPAGLESDQLARAGAEHGLERIPRPPRPEPPLASTEEMAAEMAAARQEAVQQRPWFQSGMPLTPQQQAEYELRMQGLRPLAEPGGIRPTRMKPTGQTELRLETGPRIEPEIPPAVAEREMATGAAPVARMETPTVAAPVTPPVSRMETPTVTAPVTPPVSRMETPALSSVELAQSDAALIRKMNEEGFMLFDKEGIAIGKSMEAFANRAEQNAGLFAGGEPSVSRVIERVNNGGMALYLDPDNVRAINKMAFEAGQEEIAKVRNVLLTSTPSILRLEGTQWALGQEIKKVVDAMIRMKSKKLDPLTGYDQRSAPLSMIKDDVLTESEMILAEILTKENWSTATKVIKGYEERAAKIAPGTLVTETAKAQLFGSTYEKYKMKIAERAAAHAARKAPGQTEFKAGPGGMTPGEADMPPVELPAWVDKNAGSKWTQEMMDLDARAMRKAIMIRAESAQQSALRMKAVQVQEKIAEIAVKAEAAGSTADEIAIFRQAAMDPAIPPDEMMGILQMVEHPERIGEIAAYDYARPAGEALKSVGAEPVYKLFVHSKSAMTMKLSDIRSRLERIYADGGIAKRTVEAKMLMKISERTATPAEIAAYPKVAIAAKEMRVIQNELADLLKLGPDERIEYYIAHVRKVMDPKLLETSEIMQMYKPPIRSEVKTPFVEHRLIPHPDDIIDDAVEVMDIYTRSVLRHVYLNEPAKQTAALLNTVRTKIPKTTYNYLKSYYDYQVGTPRAMEEVMGSYVKQLASAYKGILDAIIPGTKLKWGRFRNPQEELLKSHIRNLEQTIQAPEYLAFRKGLETARGQSLLGALAMAPDSAMVNLLQSMNTYAEVGAKGITLAFGDLTAMKLGTTRGKELAKLLKASGVIAESDWRMVNELSNAAKRGAGDKLMYMFSTAEQINRAAAFFAGYRRALSQGKRVSEAMKEGKELANRTQFVYASTDTPLIYQHPLGKAVFQLGSYPARQMEWLSPARTFKGLVNKKHYVPGDRVRMARFVLATGIVGYGAGAAGMNISRRLFLPYRDPDSPIGIGFGGFWPFGYGPLAGLATATGQAVQGKRGAWKETARAATVSFVPGSRGVSNVKKAWLRASRGEDVAWHEYGGVKKYNTRGSEKTPALGF